MFLSLNEIFPITLCLPTRSQSYTSTVIITKACCFTLNHIVSFHVGLRVSNIWRVWNSCFPTVTLQYGSDRPFLSQEIKSFAFKIFTTSIPSDSSCICYNDLFVSPPLIVYYIFDSNFSKFRYVNSMFA